MGAFKKDRSILEIVKGYSIPFLSQPCNRSLEINLSLKEKYAVVEKMEISLEKGCNRKVCVKKFSAKSFFIIQSVSSKEKGWGQQVCHQFEKSNSVHSPPHFEMDSLHSVLWRIGTSTIIYLDDILLIEETAENAQMYRNTAVLFQELRFVADLKKSVMTQ